jgi:hypothetical protein
MSPVPVIATLPELRLSHRSKNGLPGQPKRLHALVGARRSRVAEGCRFDTWHIAPQGNLTACGMRGRSDVRSDRAPRAGGRLCVFATHNRFSANCHDSRKISGLDETAGGR